MAERFEKEFSRQKRIDRGNSSGTLEKVITWTAIGVGCLLYWQCTREEPPRVPAPQKKAPEKAQTRWSADDNLERYLRERYEVTWQSETFENAKVIGLPEKHLDIEDNEWIRDILTKYAKDGDTVLLEAFGEGKHCDRNNLVEGILLRFDKHFPPDVAVKGWDDIGAWKESRRLTDEELRIMQTEKPTPQILRKLVELTETYKIQFHRRNMAMRNAIQEALKAGQGKVWVISGPGHYYNHPELAEDIRRFPGIFFSFAGDRKSHERHEQDWHSFKASLNKEEDR